MLLKGQRKMLRLLKKAGLNRDVHVLDAVRRQRLSYFGHIIRKPSPYMMEKKYEGRQGEYDRERRG